MFVIIGTLVPEFCIVKKDQINFISILKNFIFEKITYNFVDVLEIILL